MLSGGNNKKLQLLLFFAAEQEGKRSQGIMTDNFEKSVTVQRKDCKKCVHGFLFVHRRPEGPRRPGFSAEN